LSVKSCSTLIPLRAKNVTALRRKRDRADGLLITEDLGIGHAGAVVDRDVHVLPAHPAAIDAATVATCAIALAPAAVDAMPGAAIDPSELLDVDMDQLARRSRS